MKTFTDKERWRMAIHEAAHIVVMHALGLGTPDAASLVWESSDSAGRVHWRMPAIINGRHAQRVVMAFCAGRAAENTITGTRRFLDGTDFWNVARIKDAGYTHADTWRLFKRVERLCRTTLWVPIVATASVLYELVEIDRDIIFEMLADVPDFEVEAARRRSRKQRREA